MTTTIATAARAGSAALVNVTTLSSDSGVLAHSSDDAQDNHLLTTPTPVASLTSDLLPRACESHGKSSTSTLENVLDFEQSSPIHQEQQQQPQQVVELTFFQKYFTKPVDPRKDPEKFAAVQRQFSFLSPGSILSAVAMLLVLSGVIAAAAAVAVEQHSKTADAQPGGRLPHGGYQTPILVGIPSNFPDPSLFYENGTWYAYATNNAAGVLDNGNGRSNASRYTEDFGLANVQLAISIDTMNWTVAGIGSLTLPTTGDWTGTNVTGHAELSYPKISSTWAPAVVKTDFGKYVMYYASAKGGSNPYVDWEIDHPRPHCIGVATADTPTGPFNPQNASLACPIDQGGAIDPEIIRDVDGTLWISYKIDGNNIGLGGECGNTVKPLRPTPIMLQRMRPDGITTNGEPVQILTNIAEDGPLVEAPMLVRSHEGIYFLFFSSGCTTYPSYTTKYATSEHITGPYVRHEGALLQTGDWGLEAPGSIGIAEDGDGGFVMAFHARVPFGRVGRVRGMFLTKVEFTGRVARILEPDDVERSDGRRGGTGNGTKNMRRGRRVGK